MYSNESEHYLYSSCLNLFPHIQVQCFRIALWHRWFTKRSISRHCCTVGYQSLNEPLWFILLPHPVRTQMLDGAAFFFTYIYQNKTTQHGPTLVKNGPYIEHLGNFQWSSPQWHLGHSLMSRPSLASGGMPLIATPRRQKLMSFTRND